MSTRHMRLTGHSRVFTLTQEAHADLLDYLTEARTALAADPDADETLRDLEASLGDQLDPLYSEANHVVDAAQMTTILNQSGAIMAEALEKRVSAPPRGPFWARIVEGKYLGGVCLGIAARGGFNAAWVRGIAGSVAFLIAGILAPLGEGTPMLLFLAATAIGYLVLLIVLPSVASVREYQRICERPGDGTVSPSFPKRAVWGSE
ncbi:PspC domain-containing protein [Arthrobacter caoxuetaonis]|uniref:PspC domain-containing protein n=1 Tax=Arthrobacter caoxuetaonis TaxID=2886935 RepID=UPI001D135780|nr:PspC domain-containing protein [Arthrobacter caoxuetaonis]MCC3282692.1 PspC domain-containing protein [Arthrobacter caoxuetaonis]